jgi:hypothetical protein
MSLNQIVVYRSFLLVQPIEIERDRERERGE